MRHFRRALRDNPLTNPLTPKDTKTILMVGGTALGLGLLGGVVYFATRKPTGGATSPPPPPPPPPPVPIPPIPGGGGGYQGGGWTPAQTLSLDNSSDGKKVILRPQDGIALTLRRTVVPDPGPSAEWIATVNGPSVQ